MKITLVVPARLAVMVAAGIIFSVQANGNNVYERFKKSPKAHLIVGLSGATKCTVSAIMLSQNGLFDGRFNYGTAVMGSGLLIGLAEFITALSCSIRYTDNE